MNNKLEKLENEKIILCPKCNSDMFLYRKKLDCAFYPIYEEKYICEWCGYSIKTKLGD